MLSKTQAQHRATFRRFGEHVQRALGSAQSDLQRQRRRCVIRWTCCSRCRDWTSSIEKVVRPLEGIDSRALLRLPGGAPLREVRRSRGIRPRWIGCWPRWARRSTFITRSEDQVLRRAALTGTMPEAGLRLNYILLKEAARKGAEADRHALSACASSTWTHIRRKCASRRRGSSICPCFISRN